MTMTPAQQTGAYHFIAALDNHEPTRNYASGILEEWLWPDSGKITYRIPSSEVTFGDTHRMVFLADDGHTVRPLYVSGWSGTHDCVFLEPFPVNVNEDGSPRMREDDPARPVDFSTWMLGPSRVYHLKIVRTTDKEG